MENYCWEALTFNDVSLATCYADFLPADTEIKTAFSRNISLNAPFVSAAMDTVTESAMAIAMAKLGGIGVIHKNFTPEQQAEQAASVKQFLNGIIRNPVVFRQNMQVQDVIAAKTRNNYTFNGFPILDDHDRLVGLLTGRDVKFLTSLDIPVSQAMSTKLVVGTPETSMLEALDIMQRNRVGKLPLVDKQGKL
ncbi:MAG: IMP dehydrogenase, partial [Oligosphaeraceae bacterium]|nr:IMP dehydrogenase [Oligosphaeraceae bacterium]